MERKISVERQYRFQCSCGATTETGEKTVTCSGCGAVLGVRRIRRHRQHRPNSVAYYGSTRSASRGNTIPVRRVEKHSQRLKSAVRAGTVDEAAVRVLFAIRSRLRAWFQRKLASPGYTLTLLRLQKDVQDTTPVPNVEAQGRETPPADQTTGGPLLEGAHVKVRPTRPDGTPHPHAGETGTITKFSSAFSEPYQLDSKGREPSAMIKLDSGIWPRQFIWVSLKCLEILPENTSDISGPRGS
jgi:hypothetical protein